MKSTAAFLLAILITATSLTANTFNRIPYKFEISSHYPGVSTWINEEEHSVKASLHTNGNEVLPRLSYGYDGLVLVNVGAALNKSTEDKLLDHAFLPTGFELTVKPLPYTLHLINHSGIMKVEGKYKQAGISYTQESSETDTLSTSSIWGKIKIDSYKTVVKGRYLSMTTQDDHKGELFDVSSWITIMLSEKAHKFGVGVLSSDWNTEPTASYFEAEDFLYSFYDQLNQHRFKTVNSVYYSYKTSANIEKTNLFLEGVVYSDIALYLAKLTIEYPLDYNKGLMFQLFSSSGESQHGLRANLIWKF